MAILVTGGIGFIGSHTVVELLNAGNEVIILDNLSNSSIKVIDRIKQITGKSPVFYQDDIRHRATLQNIFNNHKVDSVIHFSALKAVGESIEQPIRYYDNNVSGSIILLEEMQKAGIFSIVFSSSATVYGTPKTLPLTEHSPTGNTTNPYGTSKYIIERILMDLPLSDPRWNIIILRYFNPVGAHESGQLGESPNGVPNNLLPYICRVAMGQSSRLTIFGNDYPTPDGTGIRDYIHVTDLALGHVQAISKKGHNPGVHIYNLGTGIGYSVLDIVKAFELASGKKIPYIFEPRRLGDIAICFSDPSKALLEIGWKAQRDLNKMMIDTWHWISKNPNGYN